MAWDDYYDSAAQGLRPMSNFEWYSVDRNGHVAFLTSAGFGAIPMLVFRDKQAYYRAADFFRSLPVRCGHVLRARGQYDWSNVADQGLFGYDWNASAGQYVPGHPYQAMAAPKMPISLLDLPADVRDWVSPIRFDEEFESARELFPEVQFREVNVPNDLLQQTAALLSGSASFRPAGRRC